MRVGPRIEIPREEFSFRFDRSSGPGGQNVNKVNSKATLHWQVRTTPSLPEDVRLRFLARFASRVNKQGELVVSSQRHREQAKNVADCLERVRRMVLEVATPPRRRKATRRTMSSVKRRLEDKRRRGETKRQRRPPVD